MVRGSRKREKIPLLLELNATTWRVLIGMLSHRGSISLGDLTRKLKLSSPGQCAYHLNKLIEKGIVERSATGEYIIVPDANLDFLDNFLFIREKVVPRTVMYAVFMTTLLIMYICLVPFEFGLHNVFALLLGVSGTGFLWAEVYRIWNSLL